MAFDPAQVGVRAGHHSPVTGHWPLCREPVGTTAGLWVTPRDDGGCQHGPPSFSSRHQPALCMCLPSHRNDFFMPHALSILGKK